ncbi:MAG: hypothetical protein WCQ65_12760, partial [Fermentimonas sp.]
RVTPSKTRVTPSKTRVTPSKTRVTPSKTRVTPSKTRVTPQERMKPPIPAYRRKKKAKPLTEKEKEVIGTMSRTIRNQLGDIKSILG